MLDVTLNLVAISAVPFSIVVLRLLIKVDGLNSPTAKPIPGGSNEMGMEGTSFKS